MGAASLYSQLDPGQDEIRVISIRPAPDPNPVSCIMFHIPLLDPQPYTALSYTWGDLQKTTEIFVNDSPVQVTPNLEAALRHLRRIGVFTVWADAICINQEDIVEKAQQIRLMREIYVQAQSVLVWLGQSSHDSSMAMDYIRAVSNQGHVSSKPPPPPVQQAVQNLLLRDYWERCWIIQELALNRTVDVYCGGNSLRWDHLAAALPVLKQNPALSYSVTKLLNLRSFRDDAQNFKPVSLVNALCRSVWSKSTEPRDRVYALLGLVDDARHIVPLPDYRKPHWDIIMDITRRMVGQANNLNILPILCYGCSNSFTQEQPPLSWIPQWFGLKPETGRRFLAISGTVDILNRQRRWDATRGTYPDFHIESGRVLCTKGVIVGEIHNVSTCLADHQGSEPLPKQTFRPAETSSTPYGDSDTLWISVIRCLDLLEFHWRHPIREELLPGIAMNARDLGTGFHRKAYQIAFRDLWSSSFQKKLKQGYQLCYDWLQQNSELPIGSQSLRRAMKGPMLSRLTNQYVGPMGSYSIGHMLGDAGYEMMSPHKAAYALQAALRVNDRFIVMKDNYVGWATRDARPGDKICLISGCSTPVVARPKPSGVFQMVGSAWIEGAMAPGPEDKLLLKANEWPILRFE